MRELAVRLAAHERHLAAQLFQQPRAHQAARAVIGIQQHAKLAAADAVGVDDRQHQLARGASWCRPAGRIMPSSSGARTGLGLPDRKRASTCWPAAAGITRPSAENSFRPLYSAGLWLAEIWMPPTRAEFADQHADGGRGGDAAAQHVAAGKRQVAAHRRHQCHAVLAAVASHQQPAPPADRSENAAA